MAKAGYHHKLREDKQPAPCFKCGTEPRLEGHSVCSGCHDELRCQRPSCNPHLAYTAPTNLSRGVLSTEAEEGWTY